MVNWKEYEGCGRGLIKMLSWHFPGGVEKTTKNLSQDIQSPSRDLNPGLLHDTVSSLASPIKRRHIDSMKVIK
jgi:hypothetical protein